MLLEDIKYRYRNVRLDLIGILFLVVGFIILYNGIVKFYGFYNYLGFIADLFGKTQGGVVHSHDTQKDKTTGLILMISGFVIIGLGIFGIHIHKIKS